MMVVFSLFSPSNVFFHPANVSFHSVLLRPRRVQWAAVPEATVDENGDTQSVERDVSDPAWLGQDRNVDSIPKAPCVQLSA
jgi:hypothetical protein